MSNFIYYLNLDGPKYTLYRPDPSVSDDELDAFGYNSDFMVPLDTDMAVAFFNDDYPVYALYEDDSEAFIEDFEVIQNHKGYFGLERPIWNTGCYVDKLSEFADLDAFNKDQEAQIGIGIEQGLSVDQLKLYMLPDLSAEQMFEIRQGLLMKLPLAEVASYAKKEFSPLQMAELRRGLLNKFPKELMEILSDPRISYFKMRIIGSSVHKGLSIEEAKLLVQPGLNEDQIFQLLDAFDLGLSIEQVSYMANKEFDWKKMQIIKDAFNHGISFDLVKANVDSYPKWHDLVLKFSYLRRGKDITL